MPKSLSIDFYKFIYYSFKQFSTINRFLHNQIGDTNMKHFWFLFIVFFIIFVLTAHAQDSVSFQRTYAGVMADGKLDGGVFYPSTNALAGAKTDFDLAPNLGFTFRGAYSTNGSNVVHSFFNLRIGEALGLPMYVYTGFFPRPTGFLMPDPVSPDGHLGFLSRKPIPGASVGVLGNVQLDAKGSKFMAGVYRSEKGNFDELNFGVQANIGDIKTGYGIIWNGDRFCIDMSFKEGETSFLIFTENRVKMITSAHIEFPLGQFMMYTDGVFDARQKTLTSWEIGFRREYQYKNVNSILGFGITRNAALRSYVMVYL